MTGFLLCNGDCDFIFCKGRVLGIAEEAAASPRYEISLLLEDASLEGSLTASEFQEAIERDGKRLGAKITRYAMQPMLTKELRLQET